MARKQSPSRPATADIGPGQYFKAEQMEGGVTIPKASRGNILNAPDNVVGPGQYNTDGSTLSKVGVSFKGHVASLLDG